MQFLMNNSILIIFLITVAVLSYSEYKKFLKRTGLNSAGFAQVAKFKINEIGSALLAKLATALIVTFVVSIVSFREVFLQDVFHTVFLTMLLVKPVHKYLKRLIE